LQAAIPAGAGVSAAAGRQTAPAISVSASNRELAMDEYPHPVL